MVRILLISLISLLFLTEVKAESIGTVEQLTGPAQIERQSSGSFDIEQGAKVESMDTIVTAKSRANIIFVDKTQVGITENSKLLIDEYIFDPASSGSKLSLKIAEGTVRYASGIIAHTDNTKVNIETPTATIAVRGTDFTMTVDEIGQSLIILLPGSDGKVGKIEVATSVGIVILDKAYEATFTESYEKEPMPPVILQLDESQINNMLILNKPKEIQNSLNPPERDLLENMDIKKDFLDSSKLFRFTELDVNELDVTLFADLLKIFDSDTDGKIEGFNEKTGVFTFIEENTIRLVRRGSNEADLRLDKNVNQHIFISQDTDHEQSIHTIDKYSEGNVIIIIQR